MISHAHKCIFVHVPRTGGTSIESILWPDPNERTVSNLWGGLVDKYRNKYQTGGLQHLSASQIRVEVGSSIFDDYFKFSVVRNPWDRVISQFTAMQKRQDLRDFIGLEQSDSLKTYLLLITKKEHVQWAPQYKLILDENGDQIVDYIGRFEEYNKSVSRILDVIGMRNIDIPHINIGARASYKNYYDAETAETVHQIYKNDIELFNYKF